MCERELGDIDCMSIVGFEREYLDGWWKSRPGGGRPESAGVVPGQHIGNFDRPAAANSPRVRHIFAAGDSLLLGTDLEKPILQLLSAYDDRSKSRRRSIESSRRINRSSMRISSWSNSSISRFIRTRAAWKCDCVRRKQAVTIPRHPAVSFLEENIWTRAVTVLPGEMFQIAGDSGFFCKAQWIDREWPSPRTVCGE